MKNHLQLNLDIVVTGEHRIVQLISKKLLFEVKLMAYRIIWYNQNGVRSVVTDNRRSMLHEVADKILVSYKVTVETIGD